MSNDEILLKSVPQMVIKDPDTDDLIFTTKLKVLKNVNTPKKRLISNLIQATEISSPVDKKLQIEPFRARINGMEGVTIESDDTYLTSNEFINVTSTGGSLELINGDRIMLEFNRLQIATDENNQTRLENKLFACFDKNTLKFTLMIVKLKPESDLRHIKCG
jgi:hypothetical protein